jgi:hypothetical protein
MKRFFGLLNLILCFELMLSPMTPQVSLLFSNNAIAQDCPPGFHMDSQLNRCLTSEDNAKVMQAVKNCEPEDKACYRKNAEDSLKAKEESGEVAKRKKSMSPFLSTVMNAAAVAVPVTIGVHAMKDLKGKCAAFSYWSMVAGAAALFVGDNLANFLHQRRLKEIEKDWKKIVKSGAAKETDEDQKKVNATEAQSQAFEMLARSEESLAKAAKMKSMFYGVATAAFAASATAAVLEMLAEKTDATGATMAKNLCHSQVANPSSAAGDAVTTWDYEIIQQKNIYNILHAKDFAAFYILSKAPSLSYSSPSIDEYNHFKEAGDSIQKESPELLPLLKEMSIIALKNLNPLPSASAKDKEKSKEGNGVLMNTAVTGAAALAAYKFGKTLAPKLVRPNGRAITSGIFGAWSLVMFNHTRSQAKASTNRASALRGIRDEFKSASGAINMCTPADRSNPANPNCYCYTPEGQRNPNRTNSQTCQKLWTGKSVGASNYYTSTSAESSGCIDSNKQYDATCGCRKSSTGCMKANTSGIANFDPGSFKMLTSATAPLDQIGNGTFDSASVSADALVNQAMRLANVADKASNAKGLEAFKATKNRAALALEKDLVKDAGNGNANLLGSNSSGTPLTPAEAIAELEKEFKKESTSNSVNTASSSHSLGQPKAPTEQLDFGFTQDDFDTTTKKQNEVAEVMKQDLDYGGSDINHGTSASIFEVLSNRYQRSGLRRLFDEEGQIQADKPADSDILE